MKPEITTIDQYIAQFSVSDQKALQQLREIISAALPDGTSEKIAYGIPTFYYKRNIVHFGCFKSHYSFFPGGIVEQFQAELKNYHVSKGAIQLPKDEPIPKALIQKITKAALARITSQ